MAWRHTDNPFAPIAAHGEALRRRLAAPECLRDFPLLGDLAAEGGTDYLAAPLFFSDGSVHLASGATRQPGGFSDAEIAGLRAIQAPLPGIAAARPVFALRDETEGERASA